MSEEKENKAFDIRLFKRVLAFAQPYRATLYFVAFIAIAMSVFTALNPYLLKQTVDGYMLTKNGEGLLMMILLMLGVLLLEVISQLLFIYFANWLGQSIIRDIRTTLFDRMLHFKMQYYDKASLGVLVTRAVNDMERIAQIFSDGLFMIVGDLLKMVFIASIMLIVDWKLALIVFGVLPIILYATRLFQRAMKSAFGEVRTQVAELNGFVQERIAGMKIVQLFTREKIEMERFEEINEKHKKAWLRTVWYNSIFFPVAEISATIAIGFIVWYGGLQAVLNNDTTQLGTVFMFIQLSRQLFRPLNQIANKFNTLQMGMVAANRVFKVLDADSLTIDKGNFEPEELKGDISFDTVYFGYSDKEMVLKGISFDVKAGETVAIVGATGAGKSTIINLLNRFYEIQKGKICLDGVSIGDYKLAGLRSKIAVVLQDVFLFADTIIHNINLKDDRIGKEEIVAAAKAIGVHEFIMELPGNYDYMVKERGAMLSSGQRQLLAFLRAYVSNPSVLVLDEATSSVDAHSEQLIQKATDQITRGRTSIVIAHRLATIKNADKIIVLDAGNIVEIGTHKELLLKKGGYYKNLYEVQFAREEGKGEIGV
ncbi:MAG: ABC transporter ATP-binding protein/permease [Flavobacteriaceae bacterium]|nr:ABC transporter ATP-binding protein/permease [Flavobacteriaceae bacterium]